LNILTDDSEQYLSSTGRNGAKGGSHILGKKGKEPRCLNYVGGVTERRVEKVTLNFSTRVKAIFLARLKQRERLSLRRKRER